MVLKYAIFFTLISFIINTQLKAMKLLERASSSKNTVKLKAPSKIEVTNFIFSKAVKTPITSVNHQSWQILASELEQFTKQYPSLDDENNVFYESFKESLYSKYDLKFWFAPLLTELEEQLLPPVRSLPKPQHQKKPSHPPTSNRNTLYQIPIPTKARSSLLVNEKNIFKIEDQPPPLFKPTPKDDEDSNSERETMD